MRGTARNLAVSYWCCAQLIMTGSSWMERHPFWVWVCSPWLNCLRELQTPLAQGPGTLHGDRPSPRWGHVALGSSLLTLQPIITWPWKNRAAWQAAPWEAGYHLTGHGRCLKPVDGLMMLFGPQSGNHKVGPNNSQKSFAFYSHSFEICWFRCFSSHFKRGKLPTSYKLG